MSVFTEVSPEVLAQWASGFSFGANVTLVPIAAGITNTNYFLDTQNCRYVLTIFEALTMDELPFFMELMRFLAEKNIPCPFPVVNNTGHYITELCGKPAAVISYLNGRDSKTPNIQQCYAFGSMLANMHRASQGFPLTMDNPRGQAWRRRIALQLQSKLKESDAKLLQDEINAEEHYQHLTLPLGVIHGDLFKDNVLLEGDEITGVIDFYYACNDYYVYDIAVALNDWAVQSDGSIDDECARAILNGYQSVRLLNPEEKQAWPMMLRAGALRFWLSRLIDWYNPPDGLMTYTKDPEIFKKILLHYRQRQNFWL